MLKYLVVLLTWQLPFAAHALDLKVDIHGLRSSSGRLLVAVYSDGKNFPHDPTKAIASENVEASAEEIVFHDLPAGEYAVAFHHDENNDGKMNFNFVGMPKEGFGFSNNPRILFGPPSFARARVDLKEAGQAVEIQTKYF